MICVGDSQVGKTSLIQRYIENFFEEHNNGPTITWDFKVKTIQIGQKDPETNMVTNAEAVRMFVWDTAG